MRAVETTPAVSLNAGEGKELNFALVWHVSLAPLVSPVSRRGPWTRAVGDQLGHPLEIDEISGGRAPWSAPPA
jgi:hypothetical protein